MGFEENISFSTAQFGRIRSRKLHLSFLNNLQEVDVFILLDR